MVEQVSSSISNSSSAYEALEKNSEMQRSLALTSLGVSLNQKGLFEKAMEKAPDEEFKDQLQLIQGKRLKGEDVNRGDLLELSHLAEKNHLSTLEQKKASWVKANESFSNLIADFRFNNRALMVMQLFTLALFVGFLLYKRSQEKMKEKMRKQEQLQSKLFSSLSEGVFLCNAKGEILACNSSGSFIAGKEARNLSGKPFTSLFRGLNITTEENKALQYNEFFENIFKNGKTLFNYTISVTNRSGHTNWYNLTTQPISPFGKDQGFNMLLSFNNITEKILAQHEVKRQQVQMMEGNKLRTIGEMAGGIAHEIDNPLSIIMTTTERLDWKAERKGIVEGETIRKSTGKVLKTVERISNIVKSLLAMAREEEIDHQFVPVQEVIDIAFDLANIELSKNDVTFTLESEHLDSVIQCYPTQIAQVLLNLTKNAIDAIEGIEKKWITLKVTDEGDHFKFTHTDCGKGIPSNVADKIIMPFYTTKDVGKGTGLGLSISRNIITAHSGQFYIDKDAENTTFVFTIPKKFVEKEIDEEVFKEAA